MFKKLIFLLSAATLAYGQSTAQNIQVAHHLTQSCYITTEGKIIVDAGGHYTADSTEQFYFCDSLHGSIYDTTASAFKNNKKLFYTYDAGGLVIETLAQILDKNGASWSNTQHISYGYTGFQLHEETIKNWDKTLSDWVNNIQNKYSYESDNSLLSIFYLNWDAVNVKWDYSTKDLILYDQNNNVISVANQKWNQNLTTWDNYLRINLTYSDGYISEKIYQAWNKSSQEWEDYQKETFTYSGNKKSEVENQLKFASSNWTNYSRTLYTYDNEMLSAVTEYLWTGSWVDNRKFIYTYNVNNLISNILTQQWATHLGVYRNFEQDESYYSQHKVFGITESAANNIMVTNPLRKHSGFQIAGLKENTKYLMKLIAVNGSLVMNMPVTSGQIIELGSYIQTGVYMLSITSPGAKIMNQKILITD
jgi:hypothetical protein